jgi:hypothetical protein
MTTNAPASAAPLFVASALATIGISRRRIKKLDAIVRAHDPQCCHQWAYTSRPFVLCSIPVRRPDGHTTTPPGPIT